MTNDTVTSTSADSLDPTSPPGPTGPTGPPARGPVVSIAVVAVLVLVIGLGVGWWRGREVPPAPAEEGTELSDPILTPGLTMRATDGVDVELAEVFEGHVTLLYLGYLNCPDACPITMDVLRRALATSEPATREAVRVVFVTTDPARDTDEDIRAYLDRFDSSFIGLSAASDADLASLQDALRVPGAIVEPADDDGDYLVGHATSVFVFDDGVATRRYPFGTRQADWGRILEDHVGKLSDDG